MNASQQLRAFQLSMLVVFLAYGAMLGWAEASVFFGVLSLVVEGCTTVVERHERR